MKLPAGRPQETRYGGGKGRGREASSFPAEIKAVAPGFLMTAAGLKDVERWGGGAWGGMSVEG